MKQTILVVDDDNELRSLLKKTLLENNFNVVEAADGATALVLIEERRPDLVLLDFGLPKVTGETVCAEIKKNHPEIVVIVLTAKNYSADVVHGLQIGADDYITKPFAMEELMARIRTRLNKTANTEEKTTTPKSNKKAIGSGANRLEIRESIMLIAIQFVCIEAIFGFMVFAISIFISFLGSYLKLENLFPLYLIVFSLLFVFNTIIVLTVVLKWIFHYAEVSETGIVKHTGIFHKKVEKYACNFIETITVDQSFLGTLLNYGTLILYDPALKEQIYLLNIANPKSYSKAIESMLSKNRAGQTPFIVAKG